ncbi:MAG: ester cyclase [Anaerolineales bacterium]
MSAEQNKALFRRFVEEFFNQGNIGLVDEIVKPNFAEREELPPGFPTGREGVKQLTMVLRTAFPDFKATIEDMIAEGDKVVVRMTWRGTHKGEFLGVPPSGKSVSFEVIDIVRFEGGKFAEHWGLWDSTKMMQQIGAAPVPGMATR